MIWHVPEERKHLNITSQSEHQGNCPLGYTSNLKETIVPNCLTYIINICKLEMAISLQSDISSDPLKFEVGRGKNTPAIGVSQNYGPPTQTPSIISICLNLMISLLQAG